jgi:hypothetical protein
MVPPFRTSNRSDLVQFGLLAVDRGQSRDRGSFTGDSTSNDVPQKKWPKLKWKETKHEFNIHI